MKPVCGGGGSRVPKRKGLPDGGSDRASVPCSWLIFPSASSSLKSTAKLVLLQEAACPLALFISTLTLLPFLFSGPCGPTYTQACGERPSVLMQERGLDSLERAVVTQVDAKSSLAWRGGRASWALLWFVSKRLSCRQLHLAEVPAGLPGFCCLPHGKPLASQSQARQSSSSLDRESVLGEQDRPGGRGKTLILPQTPYEVREGQHAGTHTRESLPSTSTKWLNQIKLFNLPK